MRFAIDSLVKPAEPISESSNDLSVENVRSADGDPPMTDATSPAVEPAVESADVPPPDVLPLPNFAPLATISTAEPVLLRLAGEDDLAEEPRSWKQSLPGTAISILLHIWVLIALANYIRLQPELEANHELISTQIEETVKEPVTEERIEYQLAPPVDDREHEITEVVAAQSLALSRTDKPKPLDSPFIPEETNPDEFKNEVYDIPEGLELDEQIVVKGMTGNEMIELEAALDRVTWEIAQNMKEDKVLVVWLLDASGSLSGQREIIAKRMRRIYGELDALKESGQIPKRDRPLLSGVVAFGEAAIFAHKEPTDDVDEVVSAIGSVQNDPSGKENVFGAVRQVIDRWAKYRSQSGRRVMLIVVTDEAGDDYADHLEASIARCRGLGVKSYVIGPPAVFGRRQGFVPYVAPENGRTYQLPVDLGPESAVISQLWMPFWYGGPQHEYMTSGFGPYALTRLVHETGGVYFMTNMTTAKGLAATGSFDSASLKSFEPEYKYANPQQFMNDLRKRPIRRAVVKAAMLREEPHVRDNLRGTPAMEFRVNADNYKQVLSDAQKPVAISTAALEAILDAFPKNIDDEYNKESSLRWRMEYNLAYGRLLAQKVRYYEFNYACAALKNDKASEDVAQRSNHWIFQPDRQLNYAANYTKSARLAEKLLTRVIDEAPGTPWAVHAARELRDPFGIKIIEHYIPPPPPPKPEEPGKMPPQFAPPPTPQPAATRSAPPTLPKL